MTRRWSDRLPVHRKLVAIALAVSTMAVIVAVLGLTLFDIWRYRTRATEDAATLAALIAENTAAAVTFQDSVAAAEILSTVRIRDAVTRACIYLEDGSLFATYERAPALTCAAARPVPEEALLAAGVSRPIVRNGRIWGTVYVERDLSGLGARVALALGAAIVMLLLAGALAFVLAQRLSRGVSGPIARLAAEAQRVGSLLPTPQEEGAEEAEAPRLDRVRVLVVDDNRDALDMLVTALGGVGADVIAASSGPEALELWEREAPDVVLCDLAMPDMDGFTVLARIREQAARGGRPPAAIAVSAHATAEHRRRSREAGFVEHVSKPYSVPELVRAVNEALVGAHD